MTNNAERELVEAMAIRKNGQLIVDRVSGDCFRACITSLLGIPNTDKLPDGGDKEWFIKWMKYLGNIGIGIHFGEKAIWRNGYWVASVKSLNFPDVTHAIVMNCQEVYFDPSPLKKYKSGENLLGKNIVLGGWYFEVEDFSKFYKFSMDKVLSVVKQRYDLVPKSDVSEHCPCATGAPKEKCTCHTTGVDENYKKYRFTGYKPSVEKCECKCKTCHDTGAVPTVEHPFVSGCYKCKKPDTIQISRKVASVWVKIMTERMQPHDMDKHDQEMYANIKFAISKEGK